MRIPVKKKMVSMVGLPCFGGLVFSAICAYKGNADFYSDILMPIIHRTVDPETAHKAAIWAAKHRLMPAAERDEYGGLLASSVCGLHFPSVIGLAAGFDKDGEAVLGLHDLGFGFVEVGTVTPLPQEGNPRPRLFRLLEDEAVINRYGFNSRGHEFLFQKLANLRQHQPEGERVLVGVNLGKNKMQEDPESDFVAGVNQFAHLADYLVINVSSPNTPGLRNLQRKQALHSLIQAVLRARHRLGSQTPIFLKISPDLSADELTELIRVVQQPNCRVDGLIVSNTTLSRPDSLRSVHASESGGLSGKPLASLSTEMISTVYRLTQGRIPIIGVGGVSSGRDAYQKIRSGASLIQIYSALAFHGPPLIQAIKSELAQCLSQDGFSSVAEAVGAGLGEHSRQS